MHAHRTKHGARAREGEALASVNPEVRMMVSHFRRRAADFRGRSLRRGLSLVLAATAAIGGPGIESALATTELPAYDAQSVGEAAAGVAHISNGASLYQNPATLAGIDRFSVALVLSPFFPSTTAPLSGNGSRERSAVGFAPLFLLGAAYRLSDRFVVSMAMYPATGFGMTFQGLGPTGELREQSVRTLNLELATGVSYSILDNLHVGIAYRITLAEQRLENYGLVDSLELRGLNALGVHAGVVYQPTRGLSIGASFRSKVLTAVDGKLTMQGQAFDARSKLASPASLKLGVAYAILEDRLMFTAGMQYALYSRSHKEQVVFTQIAGTELAQTAALGWRDTLATGIGAQYRVTPELPLRLGFALAQSATAKDRPAAFQVPPGWMKIISLGAGYRLTNWDFDVAAFYSFINTEVQDPQPIAASGPVAPGTPERYSGTYGMRLVLMSVGTTYHF